MSEMTVVDRPERHRYEIEVDGERAGFIQYSLRDDVITLIHTEVDDRFEGQGVGGALAKGTLDAIRDRGLRVRPECPFVKLWIKRHEDYQDLVVQDS